MKGQHLNILVAIGLLLRCFNREQVYAFQTPRSICRPNAGTLLSKTIDHHKKDLSGEFSRGQLRGNGLLVLRVLPEAISSTPFDGLFSHAINVPSPLGAWVVLGALFGSSAVIFGSLVKLATPVVRDPDLLEKKTRSAEDLPPLDKWLSAVETAAVVSKKITTLNTRNNETDNLSGEVSEESPPINASESDCSDEAKPNNLADVIASQSGQPTLLQASNSTYLLDEGKIEQEQRDTGSVSVSAEDGSRSTSPQYTPQESEDDLKKDETSTESLNLVATDKPPQGQLPKQNQKSLHLATSVQTSLATNHTNLSKADGIEQDDKMSNGLVNETVGGEPRPSMADANNTVTQTKDVDAPSRASKLFVNENATTQDELVADLIEKDYSAQAQVTTEGRDALDKTDALDKEGELHSLDEGTSPVPTATSARDNTDLRSSANVDIVDQIKGQIAVPSVSATADLEAIEAARREEAEAEKIRHYMQEVAEKRTREIMRQRQTTKQQSSIDPSPSVRTGSSMLSRRQADTTRPTSPDNSTTERTANSVLLQQRENTTHQTSTDNSTAVRTGSSVLFPSSQKTTVGSRPTSTNDSTAARTGNSLPLFNPQKGTVGSKMQLLENGHAKGNTLLKVDTDSDAETANMNQQAPIPSISTSSDWEDTAPETGRQHETSTHRVQYIGDVALKKTQKMLQRRNIASYETSAALPAGSSVLFSSREEASVAPAARILLEKENPIDNSLKEDTTLDETSKPSFRAEQKTAPPNSKMLLHLSKQGPENTSSTSTLVLAKQRTSTLFDARSEASREAANKKTRIALSLGNSKLIKMRQKTPAANPPSRVGSVFRISNIIWGIIAVILFRNVIL